MSVTESGPEPTGWELMRAITEVKETLKTLGQNYVPSGTYQSDQKYTADTLKELATAIKDEQTARAISDKANFDSIELLKTSIQDNKESIDKQRKQFWLTVAGGALLLVIGIFVTPIARALGVSP